MKEGQPQPQPKGRMVKDFNRILKEYKNQISILSEDLVMLRAYVSELEEETETLKSQIPQPQQEAKEEG